jgi:ABC-type multidrug transport system fused ATPase/permease subunit
VPQNPLNSFERVFPRRELFRGKSLRAIVWSTLSALALGLLLVDVYLISDLFVAAGKLVLTGDQTTPGIERDAEPGLQPDGLEATIERVAELKGNSADSVAKPVNAQRVYEEDSGIFPSVWWSRDHYWGPMIATLYRKVPWLRSNSNALIVLVLSAVGLGFLRSIFNWRVRRLSDLVASDAATRLRSTLHRQALRLGPSDLEDKEVTHALTLFTEEVDRLRDGIAVWIARLARAPLSLLLLLIVAFSIDPLAAMQCIIPLGCCWLLIRREQRSNEVAQNRTEARTEAELRLLAEGFRKTRIVRGYAMEKFEHEQFQKHLGRFHDKLKAAGQGGLTMYWVCRVVVTVCVAAVLFVVGYKVLREPNELSAAAAITLLITVGLMYRPLEALAELPRDRENASLAADRIFRYLNQVPEVAQAVGARFLQPLSKFIQFEAVTYQLPNGKKLLDKFDLRVPADTVSAIVAINPLEARCLAYLLPRFLEPTSGRVLIDGEDTAWVTLESLRAETVYVGGTDPFFTGTVMENISCGNPEYSLQQVTEAAKAAHAHGFVLKLPLGYETVLGEHGEQLDEGQAFRLSLARAILRNPALLIIEEPRSALDDDTKSLLDDCYSRITRNRTVIFLPARLSTLRRADQIILMHNGRVEEVGFYSDLVKKSQLYRHWEYIRFNEFRHATTVTV